MAQGDTPRVFDKGLSRSDKVFRQTVRAVGCVVLVIMSGIGLYLGYKAVPTLTRYGFGFFTTQVFNPERDKVGIAAVVVGSFEVAVIAVIVGVPLALLTALFITEYAPPQWRQLLVALVDLMAAVPSIIYALWGLLLLQPHLVFVAHWIQTYLGWVPLLRTGADPHAAYLAQKNYTSSIFIAGLVIAVLVVPLACAIMREVFSQTPQGEREAALALGSTRWGVIRTVVLPFARGGIIGGTMLSLGRALGETIVVALILSSTLHISFQILANGGDTVTSLITNRVGEATSAQLAALLTAGFVLFLLTLVVNSLAGIIITRSRSGDATEL